MNDFEEDQRYYSKFDVPPARASAPDARATPNRDPVRDTALYQAALAEIIRLEDELKRANQVCVQAIAECHRLLRENSQLRDQP